MRITLSYFIQLGPRQVGEKDRDINIFHEDLDLMLMDQRQKRNLKQIYLKLW
ncbi:hypothetical protein CLCHR_40440 [Clostridium chromiireducens]|uniref:Uncharacterized protein n=1 Tax=Clostridium chromiireducens TaxID=225345 RepID=A0A1V4IDS5_9CLOT|nr:hypothetical protein CLCHR_40440 [Clostridium chromiireducens]